MKVFRYFAPHATIVGLLLSSPNLCGADTEGIARLGLVDPIPRVGQRLDAFWTRLRELGWEEGRNLVVEKRSAEGHYDRLPALMMELVGRNVDVLVTYSTAASVAAKNATSKIPIVAGAMGDPVRAGLATSLARPGGNLTGISFGWSEGVGGGSS